MKRILFLLIVCALAVGAAMASPSQGSLQRVKAHHHVNHHKAHKAGKHHAKRVRHNTV